AGGAGGLPAGARRRRVGARGRARRRRVRSRGEPRQPRDLDRARGQRARHPRGPRRVARGLPVVLGARAPDQGTAGSGAAVPRAPARGRFLIDGTASSAAAKAAPMTLIPASVAWMPSASLIGPARTTPSGIIPALAT